MKVKLLVGRASPTTSNSPGDMLTVTDDEGRRLVARGRAEIVPDQPERATRKRREKRASG